VSGRGCFGFVFIAAVLFSDCIPKIIIVLNLLYPLELVRGRACAGSANDLGKKYGIVSCPPKWYYLHCRYSLAYRRPVVLLRSHGGKLHLIIPSRSSQRLDPWHLRAR
jgi:hypothetical protein